MQCVAKINGTDEKIIMFYQLTKFLQTENSFCISLQNEICTLM